MLGVNIGLLVVLVVHLAEPPRVAPEQVTVATGEWSKPVADSRGMALRGRLVLGERYYGERRETVIYVELQDASESVGRTMRVFCDLGKHDFRPEYKGGLSCELIDKAKKPVPTSPSAFSGGTPGSQWIILPSDGTIRLRATPYGISRTDARALCPHLGALWVIPDSDFNEYFLSGRFTIAPKEDRIEVEGDHVWRGTIELPEVRISNKRR